MLLLETGSGACGDQTGRGALSSGTSGTPNACTRARYWTGSFPTQHHPRLEPVRQGPPLALLHPRQSPLGKGSLRPHSTQARFSRPLSMGRTLPPPRSPAARRTIGATASSAAAIQRKPSLPPSLNTSGTEKSASGTGRRSDPRGGSGVRGASPIMDELPADVRAFLRQHPSLRLVPNTHKVRGEPCQGPGRNGTREE